jgi:hypothetical protein
MRSHKLWEMLAESIHDQGLNPLEVLGWKKTGIQTPNFFQITKKKNLGSECRLLYNSDCHSYAHSTHSPLKFLLLSIYLFIFLKVSSEYL